MRSLVLYGPPLAGKRTIIENVGRARDASFSLFTVTAGEPPVPHRVLQAVFQDGGHVLLLTISGAVWSPSAWRHLFEGSEGLLMVLDSQPTRVEANNACVLD